MSMKINLIWELLCIFIPVKSQCKIYTKRSTSFEAVGPSINALYNRYISENLEYKMRAEILRNKRIISVDIHDINAVSNFIP